MGNGKERSIKRLLNVLKGQAMFIKDEEYSPNEEKREEMDVISNLVGFLRTYDESVEVLNNYYLKKSESIREKIEDEEIKDREREKD